MTSSVNKPIGTEALILASAHDNVPVKTLSQSPWSIWTSNSFHFVSDVYKMETRFALKDMRKRRNWGRGGGPLQRLDHHYQFFFFFFLFLHRSCQYKALTWKKLQVTCDMKIKIKIIIIIIIIRRSRDRASYRSVNNKDGGPTLPAPRRCESGRVTLNNVWVCVILHHTYEMVGWVTSFDGHTFFLYCLRPNNTLPRVHASLAC